MIKHSPLFYVLFLFLMATAYNGNAQLKDNTEYNIWSAQPGDTFRVYKKVAYVRSGVGLTGTVKDSLVCGTPVIIISQGTVLQSISRIYAPSVKVRYGADSKSREGYMWLGTLALGSSTGADGTCFLYGMEKITPAVDKKGRDFMPAAWYIHVKALDALGKLLDEKEFKMTSPETTVNGSKLLGYMGLKNTADVLRIYFGGEACGIPTNYYYFGWTGKKMLTLPGKMEVGDAGVFYHTETLLFPKEQGGQPDRIIRLSEEGEADEEKTDKNGEPVFKIKKSREIYLWDGLKARKQ